MALASYIPYSRLKGVMAQQIMESARDQPIRDGAFGLVRLLEEDDNFGQAEALFVFVRERVSYVNDPTDEDMYQSPAKTLQLGYGDCNNKVALLGSLARSIGFPVRLCWAFLQQPTTADEMAFHIWLELDVSKGQSINAATGETIANWQACETIPGPRAWGRRMYSKKLALGQSFMDDPDFPAKFVEKQLVG